MPAPSIPPITTEVHDLTDGHPAGGMAIQLDILGDATWQEVSRGETDAAGFCTQLLDPGQPLVPGLYRLTYDTGLYFQKKGAPTIYPFISIVFEVRSRQETCHVPLQVSAFGYSTYLER